MNLSQIWYKYFYSNYLDRICCEALAGRQWVKKWKESDHIDQTSVDKSYIEWIFYAAISIKAYCTCVMRTNSFYLTIIYIAEMITLASWWMHSRWQRYETYHEIRATHVSSSRFHNDLDNSNVVGKNVTYMAMTIMTPKPSKQPASR